MFDQPAGRQQAAQRPPGADHVEVDVGAVAGEDIAKMLLVSKRQDGEVVEGIALASRSDNTPYESMELPAAVTLTLLRGNVTARDGKSPA